MHICCHCQVAAQLHLAAWSMARGQAMTNRQQAIEFVGLLGRVVLMLSKGSNNLLHGVRLLCTELALARQSRLCICTI